MPLKQRIARWLLRTGGWKLEGARPSHERYVLIAAPHTSNWDFPLMLLYAAAFDIQVSWMAKHTLFNPPIGWIMRALGGISITRGENRNVVADMVEAFQQRAQLVLVVPTEGTRSLGKYWKSGFYHIARQASVPIVPSFLDFSQRRGGFGPALVTTGNLALDMDYFRNFYAPMAGKFPDQFGPVRLREEKPDN